MDSMFGQATLSGWLCRADRCTLLLQLIADMGNGFDCGHEFAAEVGQRILHRGRLRVEHFAAHDVFGFELFQSLRQDLGRDRRHIGLQFAETPRSTLQVPTEVRQAGGFAVRAQLRTPGGGPLGDEIALQVKSTAYGPISLIITIGAAALLGLLFLRRLVNFVLRRRRAAADAGAPAAAPEGTLQPPPNRSPV